MSNVFINKKPVSELTVNVLHTKEFTPENVATLDELRAKEAHPRIYGPLTPPGIKYLETMAVSMDAIVLNDEMYLAQMARVGANPQLKNIEEDIRANGYALTELPIALMRKSDGTYIILEGRTRHNILLGFGMKNVIADIFDETTEANALRFAVAQNAQKKPFGEASAKDVQKAILKLIELGEIDRYSASFEDKVMEEIRNICTKLAPSEINQIVHSAVNLVAGETTINSFPSGRGADKWLIDHGYTNSVDRVFHTVSTWPEKVILAAIRQELVQPDDVREICFVVQGGTLEAKDPAADWEKRCKGFKNEFEKVLRRLSETFFDNAPIKMNRIKLIGAIPMVKSLEDKYPMDKLYYFD